MCLKTVLVSWAGWSLAELVLSPHSLWWVESAAPCSQTELHWSSYWAAGAPPVDQLLGWSSPSPLESKLYCQKYNINKAKYLKTKLKYNKDCFKTKHKLPEVPYIMFTLEIEEKLQNSLLTKCFLNWWLISEPTFLVFCKTRNRIKRQMLMENLL